MNVRSYLVIQMDWWRLLTLAHLASVTLALFHCLEEGKIILRSWWPRRLVITFNYLAIFNLDQVIPSREEGPMRHAILANCHVSK